ncbi:hypothetical protein MTO96_034364 [Rhipicephalus appendiculatus]
MRGESEKLKLENEKLKRQLQLQESEFVAKLEKSREDLEQALRLNARLQEALASKVFASESRIIYARSLDVVVGAEAPVPSHSLAGMGAKVPRTSVASRSTTEVPMPGQIGSSAATASHTASGLIVPRQHNSGKGLPDASSATSLPSGYSWGDAPEEEQKKRLKDVRKHLAQKLGDLRRK